MSDLATRDNLPPSIGLGLWKVDLDKTADVVYSAIRSGYRHIDSASDYGNEVQTGIGLSRALEEKFVDRSSLWVTSKLWNTYHRPEHVRPAVQRILNDLQLDYLDLFLIHFPISLRYVPFEHRYPAGWFFDLNAEKPKMEWDPVPVSETYSAMEELVGQGLTKQIGLSNFGTSMIRDVLSYAKINPSVLQIESHPYLTQQKLIDFCHQQDIHVTGFSPLGAPSYIPLGMAEETESVMELDAIKQIAVKHSATPAQVVLAWNINRGLSVVCKTSRVERMKENLDASSLKLTADELTLISKLDRNQRFNDPGVFCQSAFNTFFPIYE